MISNWICSAAIVVATIAISTSVPIEQARVMPTLRQPLLRAADKCQASKICQTAQQAYVYGYPLMLMEYTKRALLQHPGAEINRFLHKRTRPEPTDKNVVRPNLDTLYSVAFLDLTNGPQILDVPEVQDRFYLLQLLDGWSTSNPDSPGIANTGSQAQSFAIVGPGYKGRVAGVSRIYRVDTNMVWVLGRTRIKQGKQDLQDVLRIQKGYCLRSLNDFQNGDRSKCKKSFSLSNVGKGPLGLVLPGAPTPPEIVRNMDMRRFLSELATLMADNPGYAADDALLVHFEEVLGFVPGKPFNPSVALSVAMKPAPEAALRSMRAYVESGLGQQIDGWAFVLHNIGEYGEDYLRRAAVALVGFGANLPKDGMYPTATSDDRKQLLRGGQRYRLRFAKEETPPVVSRFDGFWSVSLYDEEGYFLENSEQRYVVHSWELEPNTDRAVDIYIGCDNRAAFDGDSPSGDDFWLPAATADAIALTMRIYAPEDEALPPARGTGDILPKWTPPVVEWLGTCGGPGLA